VNQDKKKQPDPSTAPPLQPEQHKCGTARDSVRQGRSSFIHKLQRMRSISNQHRKPQSKPKQATALQTRVSTPNKQSKNIAPRLTKPKSHHYSNQQLQQECIFEQSIRHRAATKRIVRPTLTHCKPIAGSSTNPNQNHLAITIMSPAPHRPSNQNSTSVRLQGTA
jgi:hypothetical protein